MKDGPLADVSMGGPWAEVSLVRSKKPRNTGERSDEVGEGMELM